ncbi:hypothetical protein L1987_20408 [Smallanthus sonchifolius]|uniref:Uncharacterized protein n=1 Tax=Smallanthus sonchifolius TaxID=185202 RepID=A0ACB9ISI2_9ASTR|nr:hypothetical protein L1987_20408 [Smallanthus sonchifolius]
MGKCVRDKCKGKQAVLEVIEDGEIEGDNVDCLIDLDNVFINDWESEDDNVEIEFEKDDEGIKYATQEGLEFDTSFINQINDQVLVDYQDQDKDKEEGEIVIDVMEDKSENVEASVDTSKDTWTERRTTCY